MNVESATFCFSLVLVIERKISFAVGVNSWL